MVQIFSTLLYSDYHSITLEELVPGADRGGKMEFVSVLGVGSQPKLHSMDLEYGYETIWIL